MCSRHKILTGRPAEGRATAETFDTLFLSYLGAVADLPLTPDAEAGK